MGHIKLTNNTGFDLDIKTSHPLHPLPIEVKCGDSIDLPVVLTDVKDPKPRVYVRSQNISFQSTSQPEKSGQTKEDHDKTHQQKNQAG